jgi:hypothetical protein
MPIDPLTEPVYSLTRATRRVPQLRDGRPAHVSTLWRWATTGLRGVRLETAMVGGVQVTSDAALRRFFTALSNRGSQPQVIDPDRSRRAREVAQELDRLGL